MPTSKSEHKRRLVSCYVIVLCALNRRQRGETCLSQCERNSDISHTSHNNLCRCVYVLDSPKSVEVNEHKSVELSPPSGIFEESQCVTLEYVHLIISHILLYIYNIIISCFHHMYAMNVYL